MKRVLVWGFIFAYLAFLGLLFCSMINKPSEIKKVEFEPVEKQMRPYNEQEIMDNLVMKSREEKKDDSGITYDDAQLLMKIAMAEAESDGIEGKAMVMAVILNRVNDDRFPDTIEGVIFQEHQFSPVKDGRYDKAEPDIECHLALAEIEKGNYADVEALYFENASDSWQARNCKYLYTIGHHRFYTN